MCALSWNKNKRLTTRMHGVESLPKKKTVNCVKHNDLQCHVSDASCSVGLTVYQLQGPVRRQDVRVLCVYHTRKAGAIAYFKISPLNVPKISKENQRNMSEYADAVPKSLGWGPPNTK